MLSQLFHKGPKVFRVIGRRLTRFFTGTARRVKRRDPVYRAPVDMTGDAPIRALVRWGENAIEQGHELLVLDLTDASEMDSGLVAGIILLSRRIQNSNATLKLVGFSEQFESLVRIYKLWGPLSRTGVILEPHEKSRKTEAATATTQTAAQPGTPASESRAALPPRLEGPREAPRPAGG